MKKLLLLVFAIFTVQLTFSQEDTYPTYKGCENKQDTSLENCFNEKLTADILASFTVPEKLIKGIRRARIYINTQNLFTITKYPGINPEIYNPDLPINANGVDISQYPVKKTITVGLAIGL